MEVIISIPSISWVIYLGRNSHHHDHGSWQVASPARFQVSLALVIPFFPLVFSSFSVVTASYCCWSLGVSSYLLHSINATHTSEVIPPLDS